jgi:hypothetical protein
MRPANEIELRQAEGPSRRLCTLLVHFAREGTFNVPLIPHVATQTRRERTKDQLRQSALSLAYVNSYEHAHLVPVGNRNDRLLRDPLIRISGPATANFWLADNIFVVG